MLTGKPGWWITLGVLQFLCLYTWPLALHFIAWLNLAILLTLIGKGRAALLDQGRLWLGACLLGAALLIPLVLPLLPQLKHYLGAFSNQVQDTTNPWGLTVENVCAGPHAAPRPWSA